MTLSDLHEIDRRTLSFRGPHGRFEPKSLVERAICIDALDAGATKRLEWWRLEDYGPAITLRRMEARIRRFQTGDVSSYRLQATTR